MRSAALAVAFALTLIPTANLLAQTDDRAQVERDFASANERALSGDPAGARALYQSLVDRGVLNEDLEFNRGNADAEAEKWVDAAIAYERALWLSPGDADARANLEAVRKKLRADEPQNAAPTEEKPAQLLDLIEPLLAQVPPDLAAGLAIGADALLFLLLWLRRPSGPIGPTGRGRATVGAVLAGAVLILAGALTAGHWARARDPRAVALEAKSLKEGPHPRFPDHGRVWAGERVRIEREDGDWSNVAADDGARGWLPTRSLARIHPTGQIAGR